MTRTVVILLSDKRSGSTMVQEELCKHPDIRHVAYSPHTYFETLHWLKAAVVLDMPAQTFYGHRVYPSFRSKKVAYTYLVDGVKKNVPDFEIPSSDRELVFRGWEALCEKFATPVFFEKSPHHLAQWAALSLMLDWIRHTDFRVRVIGLVRNPHGVLASAGRLFLRDAEERQFGWADMYRNLLVFKEMLPHSAFHLIRYEDILGDPVRRFREVQKFIGVDVDGHIGRGVHTCAGDKWRDDPEHAIQLHGSVKQVAEHFGYTAEDLDNSGKQGPTRCEQAVMKMRRFVSRQESRLTNGFIRPFFLRAIRTERPTAPDTEDH